MKLTKCFTWPARLVSLGLCFCPDLKMPSPPIVPAQYLGPEHLPSNKYKYYSFSSPTENTPRTSSNPSPTPPTASNPPATPPSVRVIVEVCAALLIVATIIVTAVVVCVMLKRKRQNSPKQDEAPMYDYPYHQPRREIELQSREHIVTENQPETTAQGVSVQDSPEMIENKAYMRY